MNNTAKLAIVFLIGLVVGLGFNALGPQILRGTTNFNDLSVDSITNGGVLTNTGAATFSGTVALNGETTLGDCGTASYTIPALSPLKSTVGAQYTSTTVTVTGAALGDVALISNNSSTNALSEYGISSRAEISTANTAVVMFYNVTQTTSTAVTTSTLTVCYFN